MSIDGPRWTQRLEELAAEHGLPGASLAVYADGELATATTGVVNAETSVAVTPAAVFQVGSISKVYVATVIMRLAEHGRLDIDQPVRTWMPELRLADPAVADAVTPRHLLTHTSGIAGDVFVDTGRGEDALERFVARCATLGQDVPLGAAMSYSNTGYAILGRLIERVTGQVWDDAMRTWLYEPAGFRSTLTLPEEALGFRAAFGHEPGPDGRPALVDDWDLPRSSGPAGGVCTTAAELIAFARTSLDHGQAPGAERLLSAETVAEMLRPQVAVPDRWTLAGHWGLGWMLRNVDGRRVYGHDGNGAGQNAFLTVVPDRDVALALLTNGGDHTDVGTLLFDELLEDLCGIATPERPTARTHAKVADDEAALALAGTYERFGVRLVIEVADSGPRGTLTLLEPLASEMPGQEPIEMPLFPSSAGASVFVTGEPGEPAASPPLVAFAVAGERYVHLGGRAMRKVG